MSIFSCPDFPDLIQLFTPKHVNFGGRTLTAGVVEYEPFYMKQYKADGSFTRTGAMWKAGPATCVPYMLRDWVALSY